MLPRQTDHRFGSIRLQQRLINILDVVGPKLKWMLNDVGEKGIRPLGVAGERIRNRFIEEITLAVWRSLDCLAKFLKSPRLHQRRLHPAPLERRGKTQRIVRGLSDIALRAHEQVCDFIAIFRIHLRKLDPREQFFHVRHIGVPQVRQRRKLPGGISFHNGLLQNLLRLIPMTLQQRQLRPRSRQMDHFPIKTRPQLWVRLVLQQIVEQYHFFFI